MIVGDGNIVADLLADLGTEMVERIRPDHPRNRRQWIIEQTVKQLNKLIDVIKVVDLNESEFVERETALIKVHTKPEDRAKAFGIIGVAFGLGFLVGPAVSGYLAQYGNYYPILAAAGLSFTSIVATYFLLPGVSPHARPVHESGTRWRTYIDAFKDTNLGPMLWQFFALDRDRLTPLERTLLRVALVVTLVVLACTFWDNRTRPGGAPCMREPRPGADCWPAPDGAATRRR